MSKATMTLTAGAVTAALAGAANAGLTFDYSGTGGVIPDQVGTTPGLFESDIVVADTGALADITVTLKNLAHSWSGDLVVTITHLESGLSQTLFSRVGKTDATFGAGDSSNFAGDYSFNDAFTGNLWTAAEGGGTTFNIPGGEYFASAPLTGLQVSLLDVFGGIDIAGTWRLSITDNAEFDTGSIGAWNLSLTVPAPAALALFGLAGLAGSRRRRA